ncbi:opacity protein-like surface antigen [Gelidibacter algens]|uniref:Opacity protein-like surface antigen n=1 Tax=Gelidibacter algens TaxID=49280 RepID=A0A1A7R6Z2_9FLAO|nr:outer membrane beta-barrel protein [Gelidibacter algens]OBX27239.1 opacity protein [Gelidibacter algens]RAJ22101.1 opacity protein-like surface antigen [Gelidibacter algens]
MKKLIKNGVIVLIMILSSTSFSQNKWSVEFRPDINFPTEDFGDSKIETGYGFELTGAYRFMEHLSAYAGWSYNTFGIKDSDLDFDETGYTFGLQFIHPLGTSETLSYLLRAGATYNHIELENTDGDITSDSGHGLGYQIEAGLNYDLGTNWDLRPTIRYRALSRDLDIDNTTLNVDLNYLSFGLGIAKTF